VSYILDASSTVEGSLSECIDSKTQDQTFDAFSHQEVCVSQSKSFTSGEEFKKAVTVFSAELNILVF
jgi:hypothetical protein